MKAAHGNSASHDTFGKRGLRVDPEFVVQPARERPEAPNRLIAVLLRKMRVDKRRCSRFAQGFGRKSCGSSLDRKG